MKYTLESDVLKYLESEFCQDIAESLARETVELIKDEYDTASNSYDEKWAKRKDKSSHALLVKTGEFYNNWKFEANPNGFSVSNDTEYAGYLQNGTSKMPARSTVPDREELPAKWEEKYDRIINAKIEDINNS